MHQTGALQEAMKIWDFRKMTRPKLLEATARFMEEAGAKALRDWDTGT